MKFSLAVLSTFFAIASCLNPGERDWWENSNFYQIYPRSFKDSNGDGIGDLNGVTESLEYISELGIDGIWLSPIFQSPMVDFGYDISDYTKIQPEYGTVDDLVALIERANELDIKVILDYVPNHTSDLHEWFQRSVNGDPKYRDFYVWHDGVINATTGARQPPSNWLSNFGGSAWEWNDVRQQYYLHQFSVKQPDLNFRNPAVLEALDDVMRFWLGKGISGFRIDAVPYMYEVDVDPQTGTYPDEPAIDDTTDCPNPNLWCHYKHIYTNDLYEDIEVIYRWRALVDTWKREHNSETKVLLTEAYTSFDNLMLLYGDGVHNGSNVPFNFELFQAINNRSTAADYNHYINHWLGNMPQGVFANWVLGNHDNPRIATRLGVQRVDLINILLQTLPGIAVTYYGEELGMENVYVSWAETVDTGGCSKTPETYEKYSRDPARTPFRWNNSKNAGFSTANSTWLPVGAGYEDNNVANELAAANSHLKIFKRLTELKKMEPAFQGIYEPKVVDDVLMYLRKSDSGDTFIVVLNIGETDTSVNLQQEFPGIDLVAKVEVSSLQSGIPNGKIVHTVELEAKAYMGYVLRIISVGTAIDEFLGSIFA